MDKILKEQISPSAKKHGYAKKGRVFVKSNPRGDVVLADFDAYSSIGIAVTLLLQQGLYRKYMEVILGFPQEPATSGLWIWRPEVSPAFRSDLGGDQYWTDLEIPQFADEFGRTWNQSWLPVMEQLIVEGAMTQELLRPSDRYPGEFHRSETTLAISRLNDGGLDPATIEILTGQVALARPEAGRAIQLVLRASSTAQ